MIHRITSPLQGDRGAGLTRGETNETPTRIISEFRESTRVGNYSSKFLCLSRKQNLPLEVQIASPFCGLQTCSGQSILEFVTQIPPRQFPLSQSFLGLKSPRNSISYQTASSAGSGEALLCPWSNQSSHPLVSWSSYP